MFDTTKKPSDLRENAAVLALVSAAGHEWEWHRIAQTVSDTGSAVKVISGELTAFDTEDAHALHALVKDADLRLAHFSQLIRTEAEDGTRCVSVLDREYPVNLRAIYNRPPFLFVRGSLTESDQRSIAIVGTRGASPKGLDQATRLASALAGQGVTVLSGLARGIDSAAHRAALSVGGRTAAVMGTGMHRRYPTENSDLAAEIERSGALVSQFWPDAPPTRWSFPMRNVVMSGMAIGTVVIEASSTSGAKMQARLALEHGKLVFLIRSLVLGEAWAQDYVDRRGALVVDDVDDVLDRLVQISKAEDYGQLRLA